MAATVAPSQAGPLGPSGTSASPVAASQAQVGAGAGAGAGAHQGTPAEMTSNGGSAEPLPPTRKFQLSDFRLVRTLGTGTFARVCLVCPASNTTPLDKQQNPEVYALKILRKSQVIKLKQIDHVRHERAVLADVAGHPFITNLTGSFSDHDSLYMRDRKSVV